MYYTIKNGGVEIIQGYECKLHPVGYGTNRMTGGVEYIGVVKISINQKEQKWERLPLPSDWDKKRKEEISKQRVDPEYFDPYLERIREIHWRYRLCGIWVVINGKE